MDNIRHIFFDLDHTLWDFDTNSKETLAELFVQFDLQSYGIEKSKYFVDRYQIQNDRLWALYRENRISKSRLRSARFEATLKDFKIDNKRLSKEIGRAYVDQCPRKTKLNDGAIGVLNALKDNYTLHIVSNGFDESQRMKLEVSGIGSYFKEIITSEKAQAKKPNPRIFQYAERVTSAKPNESIMIGDNYSIDILGALNAEWKAIHYCPEGNSQHEMSIQVLPELLPLFFESSNNGLTT